MIRPHLILIPTALVASIICRRPTSAFAPTPAATHHQQRQQHYIAVGTRLSAQSAGGFIPEGGQNINNANADKEKADRRALLGMPKATAATSSTPKWQIHLQLMKPITWIPLAAGVMCGAAASGNYEWIPQDVARGLLTMILAGPFMEGYSQTINDWYDRDIDGINEPYRPIPSGAISEQEVMQQIYTLILGSLGIAFGIDLWAGHDFPAVLSCALIGTLVGYIYSAPPLRLKRNGWSGDLAIGLCYVTLPWWCGHAAFGQLDRPEYWILPLVYSLSGIGPAIANDFKSIEGDKEFGIDSIPVMYGVDVAKYICATAQVVPQLAVAAYLYSIGEAIYSAAIASLVLPQLYFINTLLLADPIANDMEFQKACQPFFFLGLVATAMCIGQHDWAALI